MNVKRDKTYVFCLRSGPIWSDPVRFGPIRSDPVFRRTPMAVPVKGRNHSGPYREKAVTTGDPHMSTAVATLNKL